LIPTTGEGVKLETGRRWILCKGAPALVLGNRLSSILTTEAGRHQLVYRLTGPHVKACRPAVSLG